MRKDVSTNQSNQSGQSNQERLPSSSRRNNFFSPWWSDDYMLEPSRWFDNFFGSNVSPYSGMEDCFLSPAIDIDETDNEYVVCADLPGIKPEDISVDCSGNTLTISAERKYESGGKKSDRRERFYGTYQRSFTLPQGVNSEQIEASYDNGVLDIHIPKSEPVKRRKIEIGQSRSGSGKRDVSASSKEKH